MTSPVDRLSRRASSSFRTVAPQTVPVETDQERRQRERLEDYQRAFDRLSTEHIESPHFLPLSEREEGVRFIDYFFYRLENAISADAKVPFYLLAALSMGLMCLFAGLWYSSGAHDDESTTNDSNGALFMIFQVLITGGFDDSITDRGQRLLFVAVILVGVVIVSVLIGLITDTVSTYLAELSNGASRVVEKNHTLILGWNEASARAICQIAFLRRVYYMQNERWDRKLLWWRRVKPSSPVAAAPIVILHDGEKEVVEEILRAKFSERGIFRTKIGRDIIVKRGDATSAHDLVQVAAHQATSILIMMTEADKAEANESLGATDKPSVENAATIRCLLALRNVIYSNGTAAGGAAEIKARFNKDLRVVVQLHVPCSFMEAASFLSPDGRHVVYLQDLTLELNTVMFNCASRPGLGRILMALLDFSRCSIRCRSASEVHGGPDNLVGHFVGKTMGEAVMNTYWDDGCVLIGCADEYYNYFGFDTLDTKQKNKSKKKKKKKKKETGGGNIVDDGDEEKREVKNEEEDDDNEEVKRERHFDFDLGNAADEGIMNVPTRKIEASDFLIFVGTTSNPQATLTEEQVAGFKYERTAMRLQDLKSRNKNLKSMASLVPKATKAAPAPPKNILLLGWRPEWNGDAHRFMNRINDISESLEPGSTVTCVNLMEIEAFHHFVTGTCGFGGDGKSGFHLLDSEEFPDIGKVLLWHHSADPIKYDAVRPVFDVPSRKPNTAICLGSVVGKDLGAGSRDSRILSMCMILRDLAKRKGLDMHIVAENQQDQTSTLAMTPPVGKMGLGADFINTPAIVARSLCMNLAYPQIHEKVQELLVGSGKQKENHPEILLLTPSEVVGEQFAERFVSFGALQLIINQKYKGCGIALGYTRGPDLKLGIPNSNRICLSPQHRIICIIRKQALAEEDEERKDRPASAPQKGENSSVIAKKNTSGVALKKRIEKDEDEYGEEAKVEAKPKPKPKVEGNTEGDRSGSNTHDGKVSTGGRQRTATEALPPGWEEDFSTFYKKPFYFHAQTTRTTWVRPVMAADGAVSFPVQNGESRVTGVASPLPAVRKSGSAGGASSDEEPSTRPPPSVTSSASLQLPPII